MAFFFRFIYGMSSFPLTHMFQDGYCTTNQIIYIYYINHILIHILYQPAIDWGPFSSIFPRDFWIYQGPEKPQILWFLEWQGSNREDPMIKRINYPIAISSSINICIILIYIYNIHYYTIYFHVLFLLLSSWFLEKKHYFMLFTILLYNIIHTFSSLFM